MSRARRGARRSAIAAGAALLVVAATTSPAAASPRAERFGERLARRVDVIDANRHLVAFQRIAGLNPNLLSGVPTRASGTDGHLASVEYVEGRLEAAGFEVERQTFEFDFFDAVSTFAQVEPTPEDYEPNTDYSVATYSGSGSVEAEVVPVDINLTPPRASTSGCEPADFLDANGVSIVTDKIALVQRGTCPFGQKVDNATAADVAGVVLFNQGNVVPGDDRLGVVFATLGAQKEIPTVGVSYATGEAFATTDGVVLLLDVDAVTEAREAFNVIAETTTGRPNNVVMAGAHLDSVPEGPGINDNGSGSAALLETAVELGSAPRINNRVRFAWWGAEEFNLLGSEEYVAGLSFEEQLDIALYLNFDMVGSPNAAYFVYDGDDSDAEGAGPGPIGSAAIESTFVDYLQEFEDVEAEGTDFSGRSDYGPFIAAQIPAGGLFTGAEDIKSPAQAAKWGGTAGIAFDPCYHQACDTLLNVNRVALGRNLRAVACSVGFYAVSTEDVNGVPDREGRRAARTASAAVVGATAAVVDGTSAGRGPPPDTEAG